MAESAAVSPVERYLAALHERFRALESGTVASYIPELAKADPDWFGISIATVDGHVYEVGDSRQGFTIQSISKPFIYGLALEDRGKAAVLARVGVEPTGDAFNEISLESKTGRPRNPMINAGAITTTSLVKGVSSEERWSRMQALFSLCAGRALAFDGRVYLSERETGHRNRAISHMLRNFEIIEREPEPDLDLYFRQCSIEVNARDLSVMAATLASGGVNPITRERVIRPGSLDEVLSVMTTCGMYDYAGEWVYRIGMPAKSGVSGGILAVLPGQLGIGVFSPRLDERGNSVRGVAVCEALSRELEIHFLRATRPSNSTVRLRATARTLRSKRVRSDAEWELLARHGDELVAYQLQGDLSFAGAEVVIRRLVAEPSGVARLAIDFTRASDVSEPAARLLFELFEGLAARGCGVAFVGLSRHPRLLGRIEALHAGQGAGRIGLFGQLDPAMEWCENALLAAHGSSSDAQQELPLSKHELLQGMSPAQIELLESLMERRSFRARELVVQKDAPADELFLLVQGALSVLSTNPDGRLSRLSTLSAGMAFGEPSMLDGATRTAFVRADQPAVCWVLSRRTFQSLDSRNPELKIRLLESLLRSATRTFGRLSFEVVSERA